MTATRRGMRKASTPLAPIYNRAAVRRATLLLLLLCGVTFLAGLGRPAIGDSDEAFYAEAAREMVERGDWLTPHYNYEIRFQKPILFYWLVAAHLCRRRRRRSRRRGCGRRCRASAWRW